VPTRLSFPPSGAGIRAFGVTGACDALGLALAFGAVLVLAPGAVLAFGPVLAFAPGAALAFGAVLAFALGAALVLAAGAVLVLVAGVGLALSMALGLPVAFGVLRFSRCRSPWFARGSPLSGMARGRDGRAGSDSAGSRPRVVFLSFSRSFSRPAKAFALDAGPVGSGARKREGESLGVIPGDVIVTS
jgi:hypothetical protein